jgi:hypothetical protein
VEANAVPPKLVLAVVSNWLADEWLTTVMIGLSVVAEATLDAGGVMPVTSSE